jgi:hypothetical protein
MADRISSRSRGQIGRIADNTISQKVAVYVQNLAGFSMVFNHHAFEFMELEKITKLGVL